MANETVNRCVWLLDTIRRHGRITRQQLEEAWLRSPHSNGRPLSRRTFCNHRNAAEELFNVNIVCDPKSFEYYIEDDNKNHESVTDWLLNSVSLNEVLVGARDITDRIFLENVPSARDFLNIAISALKSNTLLRFDYHSYTRTLPTPGIVLEPYFLRLFKQRWYLIGRNTAENRVKTYALDRMSGVKQLADTFTPDTDFDMHEYFRHSYGIVVTHNDPRKVVIRVDPRQAKYFRALPLHSSQTETVSDKFSLFTYNIRLTDDFVSELLSYGPRITILEPPELRAMIKSSLRDTLRNYEED
ncbi:MAG: WYL domain-containing protein [Muribaculaceae bacterium]|nr:WYL domain-containing protein [Muribaculaceae bacterium]